MEERTATQNAGGTTPEQPKRKPGAPLGNQNARTHGFYSSRLDEQQQADFEAAVVVEGIDEEIAILRIKIKSLVERDPDNMHLIVQATNALAKLMMTRFNIRKEDKQGLKEAVTSVLRDIALPLGMGIGSRLGK